MNYNMPSFTTSFNILPIELNKMIAHNLETDKDIANYSLICRATRDAIDGDNGSFWRARFHKTYNSIKDKTNQELAALYKRREKNLRRGANCRFLRGYKSQEIETINTLRDLILESFQNATEVDENDYPVCRNLIRLRQFILNSKLLFNERRSVGIASLSLGAQRRSITAKPVLDAVTLVCSQLLFQINTIPHMVWGFEESQREVYLTATCAPLYRGLQLTELNMEWMLHNINFFRHHMMSQVSDSGKLLDAIDALPTTQKPSAWRAPLQDGTYPLGRYWKGTYAYLDQREIKRLRKLSWDGLCDDLFIDKNVEDGKIQTLKLDFLTPSEEITWPKCFESHLHSRRHPSTPLATQGRQGPKPATAANQNDIQFIGRGIDLEDSFKALGYLNPLPPQAGIPGFQRLTMMKHFMDDLDQDDRDNLWAYEGVVLPGGRIILGRWWFADERGSNNEDYSGPFILWAVDPDPSMEESDQEAEDDEVAAE